MQELLFGIIFLQFVDYPRGIRFDFIVIAPLLPACCSFSLSLDVGYLCVCAPAGHSHGEGQTLLDSKEWCDVVLSSHFHLDSHVALSVSLAVG